MSLQTNGFVSPDRAPIVTRQRAPSMAQQPYEFSEFGSEQEGTTTDKEAEV